ncbi:signal peptidase II [Planctomycetota bacterium]
MPVYVLSVKKRRRKRRFEFVNLVEFDYMSLNLLRQRPFLWCIFGLSALWGACLDLVTKSIIFKKLTSQEMSELGQYDLITGVLGLKLTYNTGIIWGLFQGNNFIFLAISMLAVPLIVLIWVLVREPHWLMSLGLGLILAGTLGNLYDRLFCEGVRDFIDFYLINWPIFNLADTWITLGVVLILGHMFFGQQKEIADAS